MMEFMVFIIIMEGSLNERGSSVVVFLQHAGLTSL